MVKFAKKAGRITGMVFVYDNENPEDAEFVGMFSQDGIPVTDRKLKSDKDPHEYLWALSDKGRNAAISEDKKITANEIEIKGETKFFFTYISDL